MSDNEQSTVNQLIAVVSPMVLTLSLVGTLLLTLAKLMVRPELTWFQVLSPVLTVMAAAVILVIGIALLALVAGMFAALFAFIVKGVYGLIEWRKVRKQLAEAEAYDAEARRVAAAMTKTPLANSLGQVGQAMGNVFKGSRVE